MFLFSVFTGLAFTDICNLTENNIVRASDGVLWIKTTRQKTGTPCEIPLMELPLQIIEKYKGLAPNGKLLPMLSCGKLNTNLKVIAEICKIERRLVFHTARFTFATTVCLTQGILIESLSQMMGYLSIRTTQIYAEVTRTKINEDMTNLAKRIEGKYELAENATS